MPKVCSHVWNISYVLNRTINHHFEEFFVNEGKKEKVKKKKKKREEFKQRFLNKSYQNTIFGC